ncbi:hypothetical protein QJS10_CPB15g01423 [Acorus calamus]|uniref:Replication protein A subunit n=1 Tax=Acorus calamus TaxID=4465 RepID=A0AAV9D7A1_ACOCL|nr:hypothetical protein QJS10_CPB15g01423 [Acorus calamus]
MMPGPEKVKLLCSFGGDFMTQNGRPFYIGGKTRLVLIERSTSFCSLLSKMSEICDADPGAIDVKFQLPEGEPRLVSVENNDDVQNMVDEFDATQKIPVFLFVYKTIDTIDSGNPDTPTAAMVVPVRETSFSGTTDDAFDENRSGCRRPLVVGPSNTGELFRRDSQSLVVGQEYADVHTFRNALTSAAIASNFELHMIRSDQRRVTARCASEGCTWRIHASRLPQVPTFRIRTLTPEHTCLRSDDTGHRQATAKWIANCVRDRLRQNQNYKPREIVNDIHREYGVLITYKRAFLGREKALEELRAEPPKEIVLADGEYMESLEMDNQAMESDHMEMQDWGEMADPPLKKKRVYRPRHSKEVNVNGQLKFAYPRNSLSWALIVTKCEVVSPALEMEIKSEVKIDETGIVLKPKQEMVLRPKQKQSQNQPLRFNAPAARMAMTRRVYPLCSLNPYQGSWTIKVRLTNKGNLRQYKNARGEGHVFNVELTDQDGTQIQATMFNEAANKFYNKFELGKVYYISRGALRVANKQFKTVQNDYEMTLNENSEVEEVVGECAFIPETKFNFVKIDDLGPYVNGRELADIVGIVQNVSTTLSVRRKSDNETIPKRDITIADDSKKTVTVSLWNDLATTIGQELLDMVETAPIVAIKSLKVGDFQGLSLSSISKTTVVLNPDIPEAKKLRSWYDSEGKETSMTSVGSTMASSMSKSGSRSMYADRVFLSHIINDPTLGQDKAVFFSIKVYISFIKPDQTMWYRACKTCNKKVTEALGSGYWCEGCQKNDAECSLRYILGVKVSDPTGEAWLSVFNEQAEKIMGYTADELDRIKREEGEEKYQLKLKEATWVPHLFRVSVAQSEYMNEKRQRITVRTQSPIDYAIESRYLLEEISKIKIS